LKEEVIETRWLEAAGRVDDVVDGRCERHNEGATACRRW
jgi:hypothetical protein